MQKLSSYSTAVILALSVSFAAPVMSQDEPRTLTVSGQGQQTAVPDQMRMTFWVEQEGKQLSKLKPLVDQNTARLLDDLKEHGVAERDIQSYQLQVQPMYDYQSDTREHLGFNVQRQINVVLKDPSHYDTLIDLALARGVTRVGSIQYELSNADEVYQQALLTAFSHAQTKAHQLANSAGAKLGNAIKIEEQSRGQAPAPMMAEMRAKSSDVSLPGEQSVEAVIAVTFALHEQDD